VARVVGAGGRRPLSTELPPGVAADVPPPSPLRRAVRLLLRVAGIALLAAVLWKVPWSDRLHLSDGTEVAGRILSEDGDEVRIQVSAEDAPRTYAKSSLALRPRGLPAAERGVLTLARRLTLGTTLAVVAVSLAMILVAAQRWRMLLRTQGIPVSAREATSLTFLGNFFNQVVPGGMVGGDIIKSVYAAKGREKAAHAVVSVFVDRILGLFGTVILACIALAPRFDDARFHGHAVMAYGVLVAGLLGGGAVLSRRLRAALRMESWMPRVPFVGSFLAEVDQAVLSFRERKSVILAGLGISVGIHAGWCLANALLGDMLGVQVPNGVTDWFAVIPPILIVAVVPLLPGGWGLGEASYVFFLGLLGVPPAPALAVSILGRSIQMLCALPGGFVFLARRS
jgi:uncharacterized protein (TIRG00374 family)